MIKVIVQKNSTSDNFSNRWIERLKQMDEVVLYEVDVKKQFSYDMLADCDAFLMHFYHTPNDKMVALPILDSIERTSKMIVFPNHNTRWHYDSKIAQYFLLNGIDAPIVPTKVFYNYDEALKFINATDYPFVCKLSVGAGSSNVSLVTCRRKAEKLLNKMFSTGVYPNEEKRSVLWKGYAILNILFRNRYQIPSWNYLIQKDYFYVQKYIENNGFDIRITIIGNRAFGFVRWNRENDFRASGSGKIDYNKELIPIEAVRIAFDVSQKLGFQSMAYDFLIDNGKALISEMSYCYVNEAVHNCPGYWDYELEWHEGHIWPEDAILDDVVNELLSITASDVKSKC